VPVPMLDAPPVDWTALAAAFRAGDKAAADALAGHLLPYVSNLARRLAAWSPDADDLVQDVLVTALAARHTFRGDARLDTWITRIAINRCRAHARKQWLRKRLFQGWAAGRPAASVPPASEIVDGDEQAALVREAVAALPVKYREPIVLCYLQGLRVADAAVALGVQKGTLEVRLSRARRQLQTLLESP
jgi:RNA polymerase sigma factor (sigma-70 family)